MADWTIRDDAGDPHEAGSAAGDAPGRSRV